MEALIELLEGKMADAERQELASKHAWFTFLGVVGLSGVYYYFRADWLFGLSVVGAVIATWRTFAETRATFFSLGGISLIVLGVYAQRHEIGVVMPFVLVVLGTRSWAQGVCEAFSKGFVPPIDQRFS